MIKTKYTLGDKVTEIQFETIEQLLEYERAQKGESYQSLPESFDKDSFHKKVDKIKANRGIRPSTDFPFSIHDSSKVDWRVGFNPELAKIENQVKDLKGKARAMRGDLNNMEIGDKTKDHMFRHLINQITKLKL